MPIVDPTPDTFRAFLKTRDDGGPIVGVNLLRYRETAAYAPGAPVAGGTDVSGREAYGRYWAVASQEVAKVGGAPVVGGAVLFPLIVPEGEHWDDVVVVRYPSRDAFVEMQKSPTYQAALPHRTAGLEDTRLLFVRPGKLFG
jgi:uncharacterized protein (DUF1330 family)